MSCRRERGREGGREGGEGRERGGWGKGGRREEKGRERERGGEGGRKRKERSGVRRGEGRRGEGEVDRRTWRGRLEVKLTAAEVDKESSVEVFVVDKSCVLPRATLVRERKVTDVLRSSEEVAWLLVNQQFLK